MDWYPLYNSLRVAFLATGIAFFSGIAAAHYTAKAPRIIRGVLDVLFTLPLVLPPTVIGFFLLKLLGPNGFIGKLCLQLFGWQLAMQWYSAIFASAVVAFPLMYRTARGSFQSFDRDLIYAGQTLGLSNTRIFWRILLPGCKQGILAGLVLAFARALGEYGATSMIAGYIPRRTATIATTVYQLWRTGDDAGAYLWVGINVAISVIVLLVLNLWEKKAEEGKKKWA